MVSKKEPEQKQGGRARILTAITIIAVGLFLLAGVMPGATAQAGAQPASTTQNYTPAPTLNTNVSWSVFHNGWNPLEYTNGTANLTLNAEASTYYANPISINPADIQGITGNYAPALNQSNWAHSPDWDLATGATGSDTNSTGILTMTGTGSDSGTSTLDMHLFIPVTSLPSSNPSYDWFTFVYNASGKALTGSGSFFFIANATNIVGYTQPGYTPATIIGNGDYYGSVSLASLITPNNKYGDMNISANSKYHIGMKITMPNGTLGDTWSMTLDAFMLTTQPISIGTNSTGAQVENATGTAHLYNFAPNFGWSSIERNGYSVAISQPMQNITEQQTSINDGTYTEQATYQGIFSLPTAPDLTYGSANLTVPLTLPGSQYEVANLNGASYLTQIQTHSNGTFTFTTVNPNSQNSLVIEVKYTTAQWDASSSPPSFFSLAGIEYYWWVALLGFMGLIGLGSVAMSHFGGEEETLRVPKGKFGR